MIRRVVAIVLSLLFFTFDGRAQEDQKGRPFGTYTESYTDLSVKTKNGSIILSRVWDGWKKRWFFNPQYDALVNLT